MPPEATYTISYMIPGDLITPNSLSMYFQSFSFNIFNVKLMNKNLSIHL